MSLHRLVVAPRSGLRRAPNKRHRIYESEYLGRLASLSCSIGFLPTGARAESGIGSSRVEILAAFHTAGYVLARDVGR